MRASPNPHIVSFYFRSLEGTYNPSPTDILSALVLWHPKSQLFFFSVSEFLPVQTKFLDLIRLMLAKKSVMWFNKGDTRRGDVRRTVLGVAAWADGW